MFSTITEVKQTNRRIGHRFFSEKNMRFFDSRVESGLYAGRFFITSEKAGCEGGERRFNVCEALSDGSVTTYGDTFNKFSRIEDARDLCRSLADTAYN